MNVAIGADHAGFFLKEQLMKIFEDSNITILDVGTYDNSSVDYPDFAEKVCDHVVNKKADFGILICGTGLGMSISANKIHGIRAAVVTNEFCAKMARAHNNANVIAIGSRVVGCGLAESIIRTFLDTSFEGGRHQRRIDKVSSLEGV